jgi:hypothetical protein
VYPPQKDETQKGELSSQPNENMQKKYDPDQFEMPKNEIEREEGKNDKDQKPKYSKDDFFDSLTNSTL